MLGQEGSRRALNPVPLMRRDRFERFHQAMPRFDLNRRHNFFALGEQVDLTDRRAVAARENASAFEV